jgi:glycosyltransferase involved in cell wall biosynthesis
MAADLAVVVTAYNEADRIGETLDALGSAFPGARLIVADDGSTDATAHVALQHGAELVSLPAMVGKGQAATQGVRRALEGGSERAVVLADGDLGASAAQLAKLTGALERGDGELAVASFARRVGGGFGLALSVSRRSIRKLTGLEPAAPLSGQRALTREAAAAVIPFATGYGMETAMTIDAHRAGFRLVEVELDLEHRATGRTFGGFVHRARQALEIWRAYRARTRG